MTRTEIINELENRVDRSAWDKGVTEYAYDCDIAERLCNPSELKTKRGGELKPNSCEEWLDVQARALFQACNRIMRLARR